MPTREFTKNHHDQDDIEIFDFTSMLTCTFSTLIAKRYDYNLVMTMLGDGLVEVKLNKEARIYLSVNENHGDLLES